MRSGEMAYIPFEKYFNKTESKAKVKKESKEEISDKVNKIISMGGAK